LAGCSQSQFIRQRHGGHVGGKHTLNTIAANKIFQHGCHDFKYTYFTYVLHMQYVNLSRGVHLTNSWGCVCVWDDLGPTFLLSVDEYQYVSPLDKLGFWSKHLNKVYIKKQLWHVDQITLIAENWHHLLKRSQRELGPTLWFLKAGVPPPP
jgi:hypothetical protein